MKKFYFLVGAFVSVFTAAMAWEKPAAPVSQPLATDGATEQYLYNVGAEGFLLGDNDWMTRASVLPTYGYRWKVEMLDETVPYYAFIDKVERNNDGQPCEWGWRRMFCDDASGVWVDNNNGKNNGTWTITPGDGNNFAIGNDGVEGLLGVRAADTKDTRCYFTSAYPDETLSTEWYAVSEEEYNKYIVAVETYEAAVELKAAIDEAKAQYPNLDLSAQEAVYNNPESTAEELLAATAAVKEIVRNAAGADATWDSPIDMTSSIDNPSFESGSMGNWTAAKGSDTGVKENSNDTYFIDKADGDYVFNTWKGESMLFDVKQELVGMPVGVYTLTALYASDGANSSRLFADNDTIDVKASPEGKKVGVYGTLVSAHVGGTMTIGMESWQWFKADDFKLLFHGNSVEAYKEYVKANVPQYDEDEQITESVLAGYNAAIEAALAGVTTVDDAVAAIAALKEASVAVEENKAAWAKFIAKLEIAKETLQDESLDQGATAVAELSDYLMEAEDKINDKELTTEELEEQLQILDDMINAAMQCLKSGADFTRYLSNPEMNSKDGWSGDPVINNNCGEKYGLNADFDVYQVVEAAVPVGLYEISMQGFYREYRDDNADKTAWYNVFEDTEDAHTYKPGCPNPLAYVYMNSNKTPLNCVYDYTREGVYDPETKTFTCDFYESGFSVDPYNKYAYPNDMATAAKAFADGAYQVSAYGLVAKDGDKLRIGVKGHLGGSDWAIFDNFKLTFRAKDEAIINKLLPDAKAALDLTDKKVGKDVRELVENTIRQAESASTVDEKFEALALCFSLNGEVVEASVNLFKRLETAIADLETAISNAESIGVSEKTKTDAGVLLETAYRGWNGEYTDAEATEAVEAIEEMIQLLAIPEFLGSDENPVEMTSLIKDASFDGISVSGSKYGAWSWTKSGGNGPKFTDAFEFWISTAADLKFSITQEISGLPAAKYELKAKAANSFNGQSSNGEKGRAYLFAEIAGKPVVPSVAVEPKEEDATAYDEYSVFFTIEEGDVVTIGFKTTDTPMEARWFSGDDFELLCYGVNSTKDDTADNMNNGTSIENITNTETAVVPAAIYNASGVRISTLQKGLNIIRMSNGKTRKVMVK